jgi:nickel-dependent lactate racemase
MQVPLRYGKKGLTVDIPGSWDVTIVSRKPMALLPDPAAAVERALDNPSGSGRVDAEARGARTACILVCDITRPVPNGLLLRPLITRLRDAGLDRKSITVLVATGLHRPNEGEELAAVIGDPWVFDNAAVVNHFARRDQDHVLLGTTSQDIPVRLDRRFVEAQFRAVVGLVEPHFMAGWSGGRKVILPGVAHADTIKAFHSARMLSHPRVLPCVLKENPLHEAQTEALRMVGRAFAMNVVIDDDRKLAFASFGGIEESLAEAVVFAERHMRVRLPRPFPVVLTTGAGYPLDSTYYQAVKGICAGVFVLEPGGDLFIAAACQEGFGSKEFLAAQLDLVRLGRQPFLREAMLKSRAPIDEWTTVMLARAADRGTVHLYSEGLDGSQQAATGVKACHDLSRDLRRAMDQAEDRRIAVIPEGPYVAAETDATSESGVGGGDVA